MTPKRSVNARVMVWLFMHKDMGEKSIVDILHDRAMTYDRNPSHLIGQRPTNLKVELLPSRGLALPGGQRAVQQVRFDVLGDPGEASSVVGSAWTYSALRDQLIQVRSHHHDLPGAAALGCIMHANGASKFLFHPEITSPRKRASVAMGDSEALWKGTSLTFNQLKELWTTEAFDDEIFRVLLENERIAPSLKKVRARLSALALQEVAEDVRDYSRDQDTSKLRF